MSRLFKGLARIATIASRISHKSLDRVPVPAVCRARGVAWWPHVRKGGRFAPVFKGLRRAATGGNVTVPELVTNLVALRWHWGRIMLGGRIRFLAAGHTFVVPPVCCRNAQTPHYGKGLFAGPGDAEQSCGQEHEPNSPNRQTALAVVSSIAGRPSP